MPRGLDHLPIYARICRSWVKNAWTSFEDKGYLLIATLIAAYVGIYSIMEGRHERRMTLALAERANFMTMVASGNPGSFIAAMKAFGPVQTLTVPRDPDLLAPWTWFAQEMPNKEPLRVWAASFLALCKKESCGTSESDLKTLRTASARVDLFPKSVCGDPKTSRITLTKANLRGADLSHVDLREADLCEADLTGAKLMLADLREADLYFARLDGAQLWGATLCDDKPQGATPQEVEPCKTRLSAYLEGADLTWARLEGARLYHLEGAKLSPAKLRGAQLESARLYGADLRGADLREATLDRADLRGADLRGADLAHVELREADLRRAVVRGAPLREADLLRRAVVRGADLREATLLWADLRGADLRKAKLDEANVDEADLLGARLQWVNLRNVALTAVQLNLTCVDAFTQLPDHLIFARPKPCPPTIP